MTQEGTKLHSEVFARSENLGLGRKEDHRPTQELYRLRSLLTPEAAEVPLPTRKFWWDNGAWLDQGSQGTCVGHAFAHRRADSPAPTGGVTHETALDIYRGACDRDPWPENNPPGSGQDYDYNAGTSGDAAASWMKHQGWISAFYWGFTFAEVDTFIRSRPGPDNAVKGGSLCFGTNWYESMFNLRWTEVKPDVWRWCLVIDESEGGIAGGHEVVIDGRNTELGIWRIKNSWGRSWGVGGRASMQDETFKRLLSEGGDVILLMENKEV